MIKLDAEFNGNRLHIHCTKCNHTFNNILIIDDINVPNPLIMIPDRLGYNLVKSLMERIELIKLNLPLSNSEIIEFITNDSFS